METIGNQKLYSFFGNSTTVRQAKCKQIRQALGCNVGSFIELATKVAELQFRNRDHVLLFRGQSGDFRNENNETTLKPTLFRPINGNNPDSFQLVERFETLERAEKEILRLYKQEQLPDSDRLERHRILRWSILQHYEVCPTPLLDVTHSLRIAASFASLGQTGNAYLFVLGVPNLSGAITASAEAGLQIVRLSSVCPPTALRPHLQEGYLLGEYPEIARFDQKRLYLHHEVDFGHRLVAKFCFNTNNFWEDDDFPRVNEPALYPPNDRDPLNMLADSVKQAINQYPR